MVITKKLLRTYLMSLKNEDKAKLIGLIEPTLAVKEGLHGIGIDLKEAEIEFKAIASFFCHNINKTLDISEICKEIGIQEAEYNKLLNKNKESWENEYYNVYIIDILIDAFLIANNNTESWSYEYPNIDINEFIIKDVK